MHVLTLLSLLKWRRVWAAFVLAIVTIATLVETSDGGLDERHETICPAHDEARTLHRNNRGESRVAIGWAIVHPCGSV